MPETGERHIAAELRGIDQAIYELPTLTLTLTLALTLIGIKQAPNEMPQWKKDALGAAPTFGYGNRGASSDGPDVKPDPQT